MFKKELKTERMRNGFVLTDPVSMSNISAPKLHQSADLS